VGKENKAKMGSFQELNFFDIFKSMDDKYLGQLALTDPKQLVRMCTFLTLDYQIRKEGITKHGDKIITD
tara:strand:+ start:1279 stop:1485 length:207 start_codon:yes stop_codon:yes gene_type:complete